MGCPRCHEPYGLEVLFDCEITYPFKVGGANVRYDFTFIKCKQCELEFAIRDDGLVMRKKMEAKEELKKYADPDYLRSIRETNDLNLPDDMEDHCNVGE